MDWTRSVDNNREFSCTCNEYNDGIGLKTGELEMKFILLDTLQLYIVLSDESFHQDQMETEILPMCLSYSHIFFFNFI